MRRLLLVALLLLLPGLALAQVPATARPGPPMACIGIGEDGRESLPGFNFATVHDGRVTMLLTRNREGRSIVTDLSPVPTRAGTSFFLRNFDTSLGERPMSLFILASIGQDGLILVERWLREDQAVPQFNHHHLRCTP